MHQTKETEKLRIAEEQRLMIERNDLSIATDGIRAMGEVSGDVSRITGMAEADVIKAKGLADADVIKAQGMAMSDVLRASGMAEADTMRAKGYTGKDEMKHAENMEINKQLPHLGTYFDKKDKEEFANSIIRETLEIEKARVSASWTCSCGVDVVGNFCPICGKKKATAPEAASASSWTCEKCGRRDINGNFCPDCGERRQAVITSWNCACGMTGIDSKFCPNCGKKRP